VGTAGTVLTGASLGFSQPVSSIESMAARIVIVRIVIIFTPRILFSFIKLASGELTGGGVTDFFNVVI
jgi:phage-related minor tail protein